MEVERLRKDELLYELNVGRGADFVLATTVDNLRENLKAAIRREALGVIYQEGGFDSEEELIVCATKIQEVRDCLKAEPSLGTTKRCQTLIYHLNSRLVRLLSQCEGGERERCKRLLKDLKAYSSNFRSRGQGREFKAPSVVTVSTLRDDTSSVHSAWSVRTRSQASASVRPEDVPLPPSGPPSTLGGFGSTRDLSSGLAGLMLGAGAVPKAPHPVVRPGTSGSKPVAFHKWNVSFSGARDASVNSFILRIEELAEARGVSSSDLLRGAAEFFTGPALVWFRSVKNQISDWESLKELLKRNFLPVDYQDSLIEEIRNRQQGKDETSSNYIACMQGLFDRLELEVPEKDKLQMIIRNMAPFYIQNLPVLSIISINHLKEEARNLEVKKSLVDRYESGNRSRNLLEPDLAYRQTSTLSLPPRTPGYSKPFAPQRRPAVTEIEVPPATPEEPEEPPVEIAAVSKFACWNCKVGDHRFTSCPQPKTKFCHRCGYPDVITKECPTCSWKSAGNAQ
ncbi:Activity-regulated cytoskeleton associated protein 2 [Frankliniella fusca]|uniref:Activity-regulated cytoskeleton associated protein 2 n=1 Tax=Frankliniella fusca TaxID=407009 RepID=A0AAE1LGK0_9NEOP|nr:Activity-regulated cytoskeleton associated protein 2 [Frankliniella fusca]